MTPNPLDEALAHARTARRISKRLAEVRAERDAAVVAAAMADHSPNTIAKATGLSRTAIRKVVAAERARIVRRIEQIVDEVTGDTDTAERQRLIEELNDLRERHARLGRTEEP